MVRTRRYTAAAAAIDIAAAVAADIAVAAGRETGAALGPRVNQRSAGRRRSGKSENLP